MLKYLISLKLKIYFNITCYLTLLDKSNVGNLPQKIIRLKIRCLPCQSKTNWILSLSLS